MSLSPEILAEQVIGYVVWASELIPTLQPSSKKSYSIAILPQWPHFYTGLLQAAGYLLLNNKKKKLLILSQQSEFPNDILIDNSTYGPIFGQSWKNSATKIQKISHDIGGKIVNTEQKWIFEQINQQLPFIRVITENKEILSINIGIQANIQKIYTWIKNNKDEYNIVCITNIEVTKTIKPTKSDEQNKIVKIIQTNSEKTPLLTVFQKLLITQKKKPEIIAYVNPGDFAKHTSLTTRYVCAVA